MKSKAAISRAALALLLVALLSMCLMLLYRYGPSHPIWRLDFARGYTKTLAKVEHNGYTVEFVQFAHEDWYSTILVVTNREGKSRRVMLEYDEPKISGADVVQEGDRAVFVGHRFRGNAPPKAFVDLKLGAVPGEFMQGIHILNEIDFDPSIYPWLRGGQPDPVLSARPHP